MHHLVRILTVPAVILGCTPFESARAQDSAMALGLFEGHADIGATRHLGSVDYDAARRRYTVTGGSFRLALAGPFYVGLAVCAHDNEALEKAVFSNVELSVGSPASTKSWLVSTLETVTISSKDRRVVYWTTNLIEAPNWSRDGAS